MSNLKRMSVAETAAEADCSPFTIYRALEAGELHGSQRSKGGRWRIDIACLDAYLAGVPCKHRTNVVHIDAWTTTQAAGDHR